MNIFKSIVFGYRVTKYSLFCRLANKRLKNNPEKWNKVYTEEFRVNFFKKWSQAFVDISDYKITIENEKGLEDLKNTFIMVNHASVYDPSVLSIFIKQKFYWILKKEIEDSLITGPVTKFIEAIAIDRGNAKQTSMKLFTAAKRFKKGKPLAVCPEGTRSRGNKMLPFKQDIFKFAKAIKADILPVKVSYRINKKNEDDSKNNKMKVIVLEKIKYDSYKDISVEEITKNVFNIINDAK